jgi:hypothetical protein
MVCRGLLMYECASRGVQGREEQGRDAESSEDDFLDTKSGYRARKRARLQPGAFS